MSNSASQAESVPAWKREVNRRLAAHKRRIGSSAEPEAPLEDQHNAGGRGTEVAARVAARYANAPSYNEFLTDEARAAVRAAEVASRAALEAQAAAECVLAELESASGVEVASVRASHGQRIFEIAVPEGRESVECARNEPAYFEGFEAAEAAVPVHGNLIEFPVELDTDRNLHPRRDERPHAAPVESDRQLSIFEVDPGSILIESVQSQTELSSVEAELAATAWTVPEWQRIELEEEPVLEEIAPAASSAAPALYPAPISLRLMAAVVDLALMAFAVLAFALVAAAKAQVLPTIRQFELGAAVALVVIGLIYQALFSMFAQGTPGMKYAGISLCTFDEQFPTGAQKLARLGALLLSLLPVGLGVGWALFDEDRLGWHDRLSQTYLRKG